MEQCCLRSKHFEKIEQTTAPANGQPPMAASGSTRRKRKDHQHVWKDAKSPSLLPKTEVANLLAEPEKLELANLQSQLEQLTNNPAPSGQ